MDSVPATAPPPAERLERFRASLPQLAELWIQRRASRHTQRTYREDILTFARFLGLRWPEEGDRLLAVRAADVQAYRDWLAAHGAAPKTLHRRLSSLSGLYRFLGLCAAEARLPLLVPNPAHAEFIARGPADAVRQRRALTLEAARQLLQMPVGDGARAVRDRAILALYLYTGMRLGAGCRLRAEDFCPGPPAALTLREKGGRIRQIGLHRAAAASLAAYLASAGIRSGPMFRPLAAGGQWAPRPISEAGMYALLTGYLRKLPGGEAFSPHSLRATTATLLLEAGAGLTEVQELLGHRHLTTTQLYDKRRRSVAAGASHAVPL